MTEGMKIVLIAVAILTPVLLCMNGGVVAVPLFWIGMGWIFYMTKIKPRRDLVKLAEQWEKELESGEDE